MFHLIEGLFFERLPSGNIRILKTNGVLETDPITFDMIIDAAQWDGVVAGLKHGFAVQTASPPESDHLIAQHPELPPIVD
jgi:hypothetical protein